MFFGMFGSIFCSRSSSRPCRATRRSRRAFATGRRCRSSSRRSPARCQTVASVATGSWAWGYRAAGDRVGWMAAVSTPTVPYAELVGPFILSGIGMALFFAPVANVVLEHGATARGGPGFRRQQRDSRARRRLRCRRAGLHLRELRRLRDDAELRRRLAPAVWVGAALVGVGAVAALTIPAMRREPTRRPAQALEEAPSYESR